MTLYLHRAERADRLVTALGDLLSNPLPDAFATEIISVPTRGVERWLSQGLALRLGAAPGRSDGVCVGVAFPSPRRLVARALAGSVDEEDIDPWQPHRAVWPLLRVIDGCRGEQWAAVLWHHLGGRSNELDPVELGPLRAGRRWSIARHLAGIFAMYAATRPTMIDAWSEGRDVDAAGSPLPPDRAWQAELWRRLRAELAVPSPVQRLQAALARLQLEPESSDLPRVSILARPGWILTISWCSALLTIATYICG
jgi:exodeoxyribonuclease V gamma subunit